MDARIDMRVDPAGPLVRTTLSGFFDEAAIKQLIAARAETYGRLRCAPHSWLSLIDVRGMAIQSQEMVARFQQVLAQPDFRSRRLAFVVNSPLARMQLQRAIGSRTAQVFTEPAEAERWLRREDEPQAA